MYSLDRLNKPRLSTLRIAIQGAFAGLTLMVNPAFAETSDITLPQVDVTAPRLSDTKPVKGYHAKSSSSSTRTDTELRDTPQSITVIPQDLIKDQSIQSISQAVQYTPGVTAAQGEGNRESPSCFAATSPRAIFFIDGLRDDVQTLPRFI